MSALVAFQFEEDPVRVIMIAGDPWFVANDICRVLSIRNSRDALGRLDDDERGVGIVDTLGGLQEMNIVSESGLYTVIFGSRKPEARRFRRWVTSEVLPSIRHTGKYELDGHEPTALPSPIDVDPTSLSAKAGLVRTAVRLWGPVGARSVWLQLGLPQPIVDAEGANLGDPWAEHVRDWLAGRAETCATEIAQGVGIAPLDFNARRRIRALLQLFGWREHNIRRGGDQVKRWCAPQSREA